MRSSHSIDATNLTGAVYFRFHNMFIGAVIKASGNTSPNGVPAKREYQELDFHRSAWHHRIPYTGLPEYSPASSVYVSEAQIQRGSTSS